MGLGLGFIPLILFFIGFNPNLTVLLSVSLFLWLGELIAAIVCLFTRSVRWVGYGLLTALLVIPVVLAIGCAVIISQIRIN